MTTDSADEAAFSRQSQIWASMYGPTNAAQFLEAARTMRAEQPDAELKAIFAAVEPDDEMDADEVGTYRPAVG